MNIECTVRVPGRWHAPQDVEQAVSALSGDDGPRFLAVEGVVVERVTESALGWRWERLPRGAARSYAIAGRGAFAPTELEEIGAQAGEVVLVDPEGGSLEAARRMVIFAQGLLRAGGVAVKVESAGLAHSAPVWREITEHAHDAAALVAAFVTLVGDPELGFFTCGMHNLGLPDAVVPAGLDPEIAAELLEAFTLYLACDEPSLEDGQSFAPEEGAPSWELIHQACEHFAEGEPLHNPFGLWGLLPLEDAD